MKPSPQTIVRSIAIILFALALPTLAACSTEGPRPGSVDYSSEEYGFSIRRNYRYEDLYPFVAGDLRFKVGFFDKDGGGAEGVMPPGLWVAGIGEKQRSNLEPENRAAFLDRLILDYSKQNHNRPTDWSHTTINELPAAWYEDTDPRTGGKRLTYLVVGANDVYVLVGLGSLEEWEDNRPLLVDAIETFKEL